MTNLCCTWNLKLHTYSFHMMEIKLGPNSAKCNFDTFPNSMQVKGAQHLQEVGAFLWNLRKLVPSAPKEDYLMQLKGTELLLTIASLFKKTSENSQVCLWRNILICYFHYVDSTSAAACRGIFVIGPYHRCMDPIGPRSIYLPSRSSQQVSLPNSHCLSAKLRS